MVYTLNANGDGSPYVIFKYQYQRYVREVCTRGMYQRYVGVELSYRQGVTSLKDAPISYPQLVVVQLRTASNSQRFSRSEIFENRLTGAPSIS